MVSPTLMVCKFVSLLVVCGCFLAQWSEAIPVTTAHDFIDLFSLVTGDIALFDIELHDDIDFSHTKLQLPLGAHPNGGCVKYGGTIHGNNHVIKGLVMNNTDKKGYKNAGLFCGFAMAGIENLVIDSSCLFAGEMAGAFGVTITGSLSVINSVNKANVSGVAQVGGFIGSVTNTKKSSVSFERCLNEGTISGTHGMAGGFVGSILKTSKTLMNMKNSTNNGLVSGNISIGGFIGMIESSPQYSFTLSIINSVNKGNISATDDLACGLFCVNKTKKGKANSTVMNSMNKGIVDGNTRGYGITNIITKANNVVSIGEVIGSSSAFTFWEKSRRTLSVYCKQDNCKKYDSCVTLFILNTSTNRFDVVGNDKHVSDLLNEESECHQYGMMWNDELELVQELRQESEVGDDETKLERVFEQIIEVLYETIHFLSQWLKTVANIQPLTLLFMAITVQLLKFISSLWEKLQKVEEKYVVLKNKTNSSIFSRGKTKVPKYTSLWKEFKTTIDLHLFTWIIKLF